MGKSVLFCDNSLRELVNFREEVFNSYASQGITVYLVAPKNREYNPAYSNIHLFDVSLSRTGMNPFADVLYMVRLFRLYRRLHPDYIFHYTVKPNVYGSLAARLNGIPSSAMIAGLGYLFSRNGLKEKIGRCLYKFAMKFPEKIFVLNEMNKELIIRNGLADKSQVIHLIGGEGINLKKFN